MSEAAAVENVLESPNEAGEQDKAEAGKDSTVLDLLPENFVVRELQAEDYHKGYLQLLAQLTTVGDVSEEAFKERLGRINHRGGDHHIAVIEDLNSKKVVASGTLLTEAKFIHECGKVGHIEDIVVDSSFRGLHLGQRIMAELERVAKANGCYKMTLYCKVYNMPFYHKSGFVKTSENMSKYF